ncbi:MULTISPECIES: BA14K family protein [Phyllobacteriaceae]|jgi:hypothetical protein|uniref:Lectin-like protein BA14k n=2 Tax=Hyphomicrobiales TaxID=356 RepID=A0A1C2DJQ8_9HYPH|nr:MULTISPECIES: BA14K family protein [Mesorhizobium]MBN9233311.1 BA14K family protein [Mesorhizobium sp.]MDQ0332000.1 hypothetical protein [Mesorhizobium sp. YL-MeA3-2017]OCX14903.1 hypothetical protein QV13_21095 [Mesorhizobium hungaricum]
MKKFVSACCAAATLLTTVAASIAPGVAAPMPRPAVATGTAEIMPVLYRRGFYNDRGFYYFNGHRGYRYGRPGWRQYNGWWFPPAAFMAGAIIGGALASPPPPPPVYRRAYRLSDAHVRWCYDRYRSYRASDNSYLASGNIRRECISPYMR